MKPLLKTLRAFSFIVGALVMALGINFASAAWSNPSTPPPGGNIDVPINVGNSLQSKQAGLILNNPSSPASPSPYGLIVANGPVGIGTGSPGGNGELLHIKSSTGNALLDIESPNTSKIAQVEFVHNGTPDGWVGAAADATFDVWTTAPNMPILFGTNAGSGGSEKMRIAANGNVGIGTQSPAEKLDVSGNIKASGTVCDGSNNCIGAAGGTPNLQAVTTSGGSTSNNITLTGSATLTAPTVNGKLSSYANLPSGALAGYVVYDGATCTSPVTPITCSPGPTCPSGWTIRQMGNSGLGNYYSCTKN